MLALQASFCLIGFAFTQKIMECQLKNKVAGCMRTDYGAELFLAIKSVVSSACKLQLSAFSATYDLLSDKLCLGTE